MFDGVLRPQGPGWNSRVSRPPMRFDLATNRGHVVCAFAKECRPLATRMQRIPRRPLLIPSSTSWIVVAEPVNDRIPYWTVFGNENLFGQPDPNRVENQPATTEISQIKILGSPD